MNDKEIFTKAILKAENPKTSKGKEFCIEQSIRWFSDDKVLGIIFSHEFAKAFWGEGIVPDDLIESQNLWEETNVAPTLDFTGKLWQYHLQQMVLEEEPLKYLEKFL